MTDDNDDGLQKKVAVLEQALEDLQIEQGFQSAQLDELNKSLYLQQKQLLDLVQENKHLVEQFKKLSAGDDHGIEAEPEKPPHY